MSSPIDVAGYYRRLSEVGVAEVARRLLGDRITRDAPAEMRANCPRHDSDSGTALHVSPHEGLWHCFACGVGGDALQLAEFVLYGKVTAGATRPMPQTHRDARDWLAQLAGLPPMAQANLSREEAEREESARAEADATFLAMTELARHWHRALMANAPALQWLKFGWGIERDSVERLMIGWADDDGAFESVAPRCAGGERALSSTGAFTFDARDRPRPFFRRRVVFPYWRAGRVVYLIGRRTPWSADDESERPKYKKLPTWSDNARPWISRAIESPPLWGEDILLGRPSTLLVVEGVTDAIAAQQAGFEVVAMTGARLPKNELERVVRRLRGAGTVVIAQDNELSSIGAEAAVRTARALDREGVRCRVAIVPTRAKHDEARARLATILGPQGQAQLDAERPERRSALARRLAGDARAAEVEKLIADAKVDVADFFVQGGTRAELAAAVDASQDAISAAIARAPKLDNPAEQAKAIAPLLAEISTMGAAEKAQRIAELRARTGLSLGIIRSEVAAAGKTGGDSATKASAPAVPTSEPGSCREVVERETMAAAAAGRPTQWSAVAERVYAWLVGKGARFFRDGEGSPSMFHDNELWTMTGEGGQRSRYEGLIYRLTGLVPTATSSRTFYSTLAAIATDRGEERAVSSWVRTDVTRATVWVNLNNARHELAKVSPKGVEIVRNGDNADGVILSGDSKFAPLDFDASADPAMLEEDLGELLTSKLACPHGVRRAIVAWILCLPLLEFSGTRPMLRLEGPAGSGKTWAAKTITTLVYGNEEQKRSTDAANYTDAARNPLIALDNVEVGNATPALIDFMLTSVTGIVREKRGRGSDSSVVSERPTCLVMSTGIEPLAGELEEVQSRSLTIRFDGAFKDGALLEKRALARIREARGRLLSAALMRASRVLGLVALGMHEKSMELMRSGLGAHTRSRCDEFLALMYLQDVAACAEAHRPSLFGSLSPSFRSMVREIDTGSASAARDASPVATPMLALFSALADGKTGDPAFGLDVDDSRHTIRAVAPTMLFLALRRIARDRGVPFRYTNAAQFGVRLAASLDALRAQGIEVDERTNALGAKVYTMRWDIDRGAMTRFAPGADGAPEPIAPAPPPREVQLGLELGPEREDWS